MLHIEVLQKRPERFLSPDEQSTTLQWQKESKSTRMLSREIFDMKDYNIHESWHTT